MPQRAPALLQSRVSIFARGAPRRRQSKQNTGQNRRAGRESRDSPVGRQVWSRRNTEDLACYQTCQAAAGPISEQASCYRARHGQRHALCHHLSRKPRPACSQRHAHSKLVVARRCPRQHQARQIHARQQQHKSGNGQHNVKWFGEASAQQRLSFRSGLHPKLQLAKAAKLRDCVIRRSHLLPNRWPQRIQLRAGLFQRCPRFQAPCRLQPARRRTPQILLQIRLVFKQLRRREWQRYLQLEVRANSSEPLAGHTDDGERNSLDLQRLADDVPRSPIMPFPEAVAKHRYLCGCRGAQILFIGIEQAANFRNGAEFRIEVVVRAPNIRLREPAVHLRIEDPVAPPGKRA